MDLNIGVVHSVEGVLDTLTKNQWAGGALNIDVEAEKVLGAATTLANVEDQCGAATHGLEQVLPRDFQKHFAEFPCPWFSERVRDRNKQEFELYSRLTVHFTSVTNVNFVLRAKQVNLFDLVAIHVRNKDQFDVAIGFVKQCLSSGSMTPFDIIQFDLRNYNETFRIGPSDMRCLKQAKVFLELPYVDILPVLPPRIETRQRAIRFANCLTQHVSRGFLKANGKFCNVILSSGSRCSQILQLKRPQEVMTLGTVMGLSPTIARASITTSCQAVLERAEKRRRSTIFF